MNSMKSIFCLLLFTIQAGLIFSQSSKTGNWFYYLGNNALNKKWNLHSELQYRNYNFAGDREQLLLRTGLGYNLSDNNNNLLLGYAFVITDSYINENEKMSVKENRLFQQFITKQTFNRFYLTHRYRLEERWIDNKEMAFRFRYLLGLNIPLNNATLSEKTFYLSAYNEVFLNTTGRSFDRDRIYFGLGYNFTKQLKLELGFMSQRLEGRHRNQSVINFINAIPFKTSE